VLAADAQRLDLDLLLIEVFANARVVAM